ncbi:glycoside hydrolase family 97 protein [Sphingobacterium alkalisoli]|uniref:Glycoside hydrolase family 97 protein n=1 Tax=Sphingobacterium alkalisoli TaxID=1874115 RepID=A0A4U0H8S9_9SPHI|nr:glycoside hydrolase family 97 protein [Sphingobacterium alkalisoli]TJY68166.1 glycoside hydrolase family 97 protein [Sphingobacterium alkalisoli]GGH08570.1 alpha-glucosidase [Sphingobacterium alkalisoli]
MKYLVFVFVFLTSLTRGAAQSGRSLHNWQLNSPDGQYTVHISQYETATDKRQLYYSIDYKGKNILKSSTLGIHLENQLFESALGIENDPSEWWCENLDFVSESREEIKNSWEPLYGERQKVRNHYNELVLKFTKFGEGNSLAEGQHGTSYDKRRSYEMHLVFRTFDEGVAFRYHFPESSNGLFLHIVGEQTEFAFEPGALAYYERWAQGPYSVKQLADWKDESERPLTLKLKNGLYVSLLEAQMIDYARTKFKLHPTKKNTLVASIYDNVDAISPFSTSWRLIMAAEQPGQLIENNDIVLNLNAPNVIENTSWIKPGKVIRSNLTTADAMECIDFAAERGLQYVHLDAGWYGTEMKVNSDATKVVENRDIDMQQIINYGATKGIGIFVYVNQRALYGNLDTLFSLYQKWGLKGVKFGFVQVGSNRWSTWLHDAVKKAAEYQLLVDIHDEYRPTGFSRTYPNMLTQEGIRGNEEMPDATHNTILPFTRFLAGAGDYTLCYYNNRIKTTRAHQLALSVIYYSPLQFLYWYDKPIHYKGEPEIAFFDKVKTVWDDTKVLNGEIGEYITMARRSGEEWFIGAIGNNDSQKITVPFDFLEQGKKYMAEVYVDDDEVNTRTKVGVLKIEVDATVVQLFELKKSGGVAIHVYPK